MKTYCKGVAIDAELAGRAYDLFRKKRFRGKDARRRDMREFFSRPRDEVVAECTGQVSSREVSLDPIEYYERVEPMSGKVRVIGRETPRSQFMDYVAVEALRPLLDARLGEYQCSSVPGRGQSRTRRAIRRWLRSKRARHWAKMDVRKCYPSIDRARLMRLLSKECGSPDALYLVGAIIETHAKGLNIGSYLSLHLANWYLSHAYHFACEQLRKTRVNRRTGVVTDKRLVSRVLFYMDDVLLLGPDARDLKMACRMLSRYLSDFLGLEFKGFKVRAVDAEPIDMCGWRFSRGCVTVRKKLFVMARRSFLRCARRRPALSQARRAVSYYGFVKAANCRRWRARERVDRTHRRCRAVIGAAARAA